MLGDYFLSTASTDLLSLVVGDKIGSGVFRDVYEYLPDPTCVIKFEEGAKSFHNVNEWELWNRVSNNYKEDVSKWFAPCVEISNCGVWLIQKKTKPTKKYPDKLPLFLTDTHTGNYGMYKGNFVCHDYGFNCVADYGLTKRMKKVEWR